MKRTTEDEIKAMQAEMARWEAEHPDATMRDIELQVEQALARVGAQMMTDIVSRREERIKSAGAVRCPKCGEPVSGRGKRTRRLQGAHNEAVEIARDYVTCRTCGHGFFPSGSGAGAD